MLDAMSLSLIVGPPNSGRAGEIGARFEAALERDPVLVVPTLDDVDRFERELCEGGRAVVGGSIGTFRRLTDEVAASTRAELRPLLSGAQRLAFVRAAIRETELRLLSGSAGRPGFAPALERLIGELQAAVVEPDELARSAAELDDGGYEEELARLYASYVRRREAAGRDDVHSAAHRAAASLRARREGWEGRPVLVYGFDDLTEEQLDLVAALAGACEVTVAVNYADREALVARAQLMARLGDELGGEVVSELAYDGGYTKSATLRQLDQALFEPGGARVTPDGGIALLECAGERGEAEAIGGEIARLLADGVEPDDIAIVLRHPESRGLLYGQVLDGFGIPVAVEAQVPLPHTAVGRGLAALARSSAPEGAAEDLLAFMRARPGVPQQIGDWIERRVRREQVRTADEAVAGWKSSPAMLARLREARGSGWLRALAAAALELAEEAHAGREPVQGQASHDQGSAAVPFEPLEVRAATTAAAALEELAALEATPGSALPSPAEALVALENLRVALWRGPTEGRVRVLSPYRVRAARARHLFLASLQDGEFPGAQTADPLLGDERRARLGIAALSRQDPAREERYLFHACVSRPTERLWLSWRSSDEEGRPATRSPFVDDVLDLLGPSPEQAEERLKRVHGLDHVVFASAEAPSPRELARSLAASGPRIEPDRPGPLASAEVLAELAGRDPMGAGTLEKWIECPYRWFVDHELQPQRLEPEPEPLTAGSIVHQVLERLYRDPPGADRIPRPADLERWRQRAAELLAEEAEGRGLRLDRPLSGIALARMGAQIGRLLERESRSETELRPVLLEASFADEEGRDKGSLDLGELRLHGQIDRVDTTPDGRFGLVYDYKTGSKVWAGTKLGEEGKLQLQLYARALRDLWGIEPLGGLYYQLGGSGDPKPRGFVIDDVEATGPLDLTRTDRLPQEVVRETLETGVQTAREKAVAMRRGKIGREPNQGRCPPWCRYQAICRLERSIGTEEAAANGDDAPNGG
jgi:PD-(D/E)XK nuclease superfamily protein/AddB-like protein